eukprot:814866-Amphidinium_carterae.1
MLCSEKTCTLCAIALTLYVPNPAYLLAKTCRPDRQAQQGPINLFKNLSIYAYFEGNTLLLLSLLALDPVCCKLGVTFFLGVDCKVPGAVLRDLMEASFCICSDSKMPNILLLVWLQNALVHAGRLAPPSLVELERQGSSSQSGCKDGAQFSFRTFDSDHPT